MDDVCCSIGNMNKSSKGSSNNRNEERSCCSRNGSCCCNSSKRRSNNYSSSSKYSSSNNNNHSSNMDNSNLITKGICSRSKKNDMGVVADIKKTLLGAGRIPESRFWSCQHRQEEEVLREGDEALVAKRPEIYGKRTSNLA